MSEQPAPYIGLPEDLVPLPDLRGKSRITEAYRPVVRISNSGFTISATAMALIGCPERIQIDFGSRSRMLAIRAGAPKGHKLSIRRGVGQLIMRRAVKLFELPAPKRGHGHTFPAQLVEGALLVGPLPPPNRAES